MMTPARALETTQYNWLETEENKHAYVTARTSMLPEDKREIGIRERLRSGISYRALYLASDLGYGPRREPAQTGLTSVH